MTDSRVIHTSLNPIILSFSELFLGEKYELEKWFLVLVMISISLSIPHTVCGRARIGLKANMVVKYD